jgi:hypothetical protein
MGVYSVGHRSSYAVLLFDVSFSVEGGCLCTRSCVGGSVVLLYHSVSTRVLGWLLWLGFFQKDVKRWHSGRRCGHGLNGYCF